MLESPSSAAFDDFDDFGAPEGADGAVAPAEGADGAGVGGGSNDVAPLAGGADDGTEGAAPSELEAQLSQARLERERANVEMAAASFMTELDAPAGLERSCSFDSTPSEVDDLDFANLTPVGSDAEKLKALDAGGVTDDEFNALFGAD